MDKSPLDRRHIEAIIERARIERRRVIGETIGLAIVAVIRALRWGGGHIARALHRALASARGRNSARP